MGKTDDRRERCVYCGKETKYSQSEPITERLCYVEGVGQLCIECYEKIYSRVGSEIRFVED
ncbi:MAG: hypothetical protein NC452_03615 [Eubacterium sp.]|nr:hypothetical protein [Eubacterium sp.]